MRRRSSGVALLVACVAGGVWRDKRTDVLAVTSAQMITADMVPDAPGIWLTAISAITCWRGWWHVTK